MKAEELIKGNIYRLCGFDSQAMYIGSRKTSDGEILYMFKIQVSGRTHEVELSTLESVKKIN